MKAGIAFDMYSTKRRLTPNWARQASQRVTLAEKRLVRNHPGKHYRVFGFQKSLRRDSHRGRQLSAPLFDVRTGQ